MRVLRRTVLVFVLSAMGGTIASAELPLTVSPGGLTDFEQIAGRCPTFHWELSTGPVDSSWPSTRQDDREVRIR